MALSWPVGPTVGQIYTGPSGGSWVWNGYAWLSNGTIIEPGTLYKALLTQGATAAPTAFVVTNTLGATGTYFYISPGVYYYNNPGAFPDETKVEIEIENLDVNGYTMTNNVFNAKSAVWVDTDNIMIRTANISFLPIPTGGTGSGLTTPNGSTGVTVNDILVDSLLNNTRFNIVVHP